MKDEIKDTYIQLRVTEREKKEIKAQAKKKNFDSVAQYILMLFRKFGDKV